MAERLIVPAVWIENDSDYRDIRCDLFIDPADESGDNDLFLRFSFPNAGKGLGFGLTPYVALVHGSTIVGEIPLDATTVAKIGALLTQASERFTVPLDKFGAPVLAGRSEDPTPGVREVFMIDEETGADTDQVLLTSAPADINVARWVLSQAVEPEGGVSARDGRSGMQWFRLQNGDLILGCYPQGECYEATETDPGRP